MADQARGTNYSSSIISEAKYGEINTSPSARKVYLVSDAMAAKQSKIQDDTLRKGRGRGKPGDDNLDPGGTITMNIGAESLGVWLRHAMGVVVSSGTPGVLHTFTPAIAAEVALPSFTYERYFPFSSASKYERFLGCKINTVEWSFPVKGYPTIAFGIVAAGHELSDVPVDATPTDYGHTSFTAFNASLTQDGAAVAKITDVKIQQSNDLDTDGYSIGTGGVRTQLPEGFFGVTGNFSARFDNMAYMNAALAGADHSMVLRLARGSGNGTAGNEMVEITIDPIVYERNSPQINGPKGIMLDVPFQNYDPDGSGGYIVKLANLVAGT